MLTKIIVTIEHDESLDVDDAVDWIEARIDDGVIAAYLNGIDTYDVRSDGTVSD